MNSSRLFDLFCELVRIESPSRHEALMAKRCEQELIELGFSVRFDDSSEQTGSDTGNLIAHLPGTAPGHVVLSAHMDTVSPCKGIEPIVVDGIIRSAGDTILSADDKAGIAAIFEGVRSILENQSPRPDITVVLTTCEELSLLGAGALASEDLPQGAPCYVFDADGAPGTIILAAPCHYRVQADFKGRAAHAGVEPEAGISAIQMAAAAIESMPLGRLDEATTANVGMISGGYEVNVVPDSCTISGECRSFYRDRAEVQRDVMVTACKDAAKRFGGTVEVEWKLDYDAVVYEEDSSFVQGIVCAVHTAGLKPHFHRSGGGADSNMLCAHGVQAVTLGIGMTRFHSTEEYITVDHLEESSRLVEALVAQGAAE